MPTSTIWPVGALAKETSLAVPRESLVITTRSESWPSKSVVAKVSKLAQVPLSQYGFRRLLFSHMSQKTMSRKRIIGERTIFLFFFETSRFPKCSESEVSCKK